MRGSAFIAFFGIATAISGSLVGCSDDDDEDEAKPAEVTKSGEGESCRFTDDCGPDLACYSGVCLRSSSGTGGTDGTGGSGTGGTSVLGGENESCTRRADCRPGFSCFNQRCTMGDTGDGGDGNTPTPTLGARGETCLVTPDCEAGLVCRPSGAVGVCTDADSGVAPTGNVCGAECRTPADCCELPIELHAQLGAKSCTEISDLLASVNCGTTMVVLEQELCFARDAYCECEPDAWECNAGACLYVATCSADGLAPGGCPPLTRTGRTLLSVCDVDDTELCQAPAVEPPCGEDADCDGLAVTDDIYDTCVAGECTCHEGGCYRRCSEDLDCRAMLVCDPIGVCFPPNTCATDDACKRTLGDSRAICNESQGVCTLRCETDLDCGGLIGGQLDSVCNDDGMCEELGCVEDTECGGTVNGARYLCTPRADAAGVRGPQSAITE